MTPVSTVTLYGDGMNQTSVLDLTASNDDDDFRDTRSLLHDFSAFNNNLKSRLTI